MCIYNENKYSFYYFIRFIKQFSVNVKYNVNIMFAHFQLHLRFQLQLHFRMNLHYSDLYLVSNSIFFHNVELVC